MHPSEMKEKAYQILTCATSAWHLCDWVYGAMTEEQRVLHRGSHGGLRGFQEWACEKCMWLKLCRQIAVANKHFRVETHNNPRIGTDQVMIAVAGRKGSWFQSESAFTIDDKWVSAGTVFQPVSNLWRKLLQELGLYLV